MIHIQNISKTYPGSNKKANKNITFDLKKGEILCVAGENGAGKTTLMKILMGLEKHDGADGEIKINGNIGMVHQHFMLFDEYTVAQNIVMGAEPKKWGMFLDNKKANEVSDEIIRSNNFSINPVSKIKELTLGEMQQTEICRILYRNCDIIILDEPTSILTENETQSLFKTLKTLVKNGKSVILITHKLKEIKQISDRVAVLRRGELIGIRGSQEIDENEIAQMMVGDKKIEYNKLIDHDKKIKIEETPSAEAEEHVIEFKNVTVRRKGQKRPLLEDVSFSVNKGEILGFAGVGGNGLGVIEAVLGGFLHPESGQILHRDRDISQLNIRALRNQGLSYVPADRIRVGSAREATIEENSLIGNYRRQLNPGVFSRLKNYNIQYHNIKDKASTLSGGNLQKLILARETNLLKDYIVFSELTWGLDIASISFFYEKIDEIKRKGNAIILISTDLDEILALSDRIIVMYRGKIAGEYKNNGDEIIKEKIGRNMAGLEINKE
jgi:simple sugar transport system ATP-binding protein